MSLTLEQAKQEVWRVEDELVAFVPAGSITTQYPRSETSRVIFECEAPGTYYWPGGVQLGLAPEADSAVILGAIHDEWATRDDWTVSWVDTGAEGAYQLDLLRRDGLHVGVMNLKSNTVLDFRTFSPCFELADYDPNKDY